MVCKFIAFFGLVLAAAAQTYTVSTVAGGVPAIGQNTRNYGLLNPTGIAVDSQGNYYVALQYWCQVWVVNASGTLTSVIGNGACGFSGDNGPASAASLNNPKGIAIDSGGNIYIADSSNSRIRKVSAGIITTFAGAGTDGFNGDGIAATSAQLSVPSAVAADAAGNVYIADANNNRIRKISGGIIATVAGNGTQGYNGDGISATAAELFFPQAVALDNSGNIYIADSNNYRIRKVSGGIITTVAGTGTGGYNGDGIPATTAQITSPYSVAVDNSGNIYISDANNSRIREVSGGIITTLVTSSFPWGLTFSGGNLFFADNVENKIVEVSGGVKTTVVGNGSSFGGDGGPATGAVLTQPAGVAVDSNGNLLVADPVECVVRRISAGTITTVAGAGLCDYNGDGISATSADLGSPYGVAVDGNGNIFIADYGSQRVRKISGGIITTVAGNGIAGYNGDGISAVAAELSYPRGIAVDTNGDLYIADQFNHRVRKVSAGLITTVAGNGTPGYNGDGISATSAELNSPSGVSLDTNGNLYIADSNNGRIRRVSGGVITTVAGNGTCCAYNGDGISATSAEIGNAYAVVTDSSGNLYIAGSQNDRIRKVSGGIISTIAGNGIRGFTGDSGPATNAEFAFPWGIALDAQGNLYIADELNNRIRKLTTQSCSYSLTLTTAFVGPAASFNNMVGVNASAGCAWTATSNTPSLLTVTGGASGTGPGAVTYSVGSNPKSGGQFGTLTIAGQTVAVTQAGQGCQVTFTPSSISLPATATNTTVGITTSGNDCAWTAAGTAPWLTTTSSGTGNGSINYTASANPSPSNARSASINVSVSTTNTLGSLSVSQTGSICTYSLTQSGQSFSANANSGAVILNTSAGCPWTATSNNPSWLTVTATPSGTGATTISFGSGCSGA
jgi:sugar lactone lactonase YvrE